jgi:hypothetical protein
VLIKNILVNGKMIFLMDMENIIGYKIRLNIKFSRMLIKDIGVKEKGRVLVHFFTRTDADSKDILIKI